MFDKKDKDIIELWWEYLKRSKKYSDFCQWMNQNEKLPISESLKKHHQALWNTWMNFGDVHSQPFAEWWKSELDNPFLSPIKPYYTEYESGKCMVDYRTVIGKDINKIYQKFKKEQGREPSIKELIYNLKSYMNHWDNERAYLVIEYQHESIKTISAEFQDYLREKRKENPAREVSRTIKGMKGITTIKKKPATVEELRRYLKVYDYYKEGRKIDEITDLIWEILPPSNDDSDEIDDRYESVNVQREIRRDLQKANKIIHNVECGYFPGEF
jgi:hypothetical protein